MVDTYLELRNGNNTVIIDDKYSNLSFVHITESITVKASDEISSGSVPWYNISSGSFGRYKTYSRFYSFKELDVKPGSRLSYIGFNSLDGYSAQISVSYETENGVEGVRYVVRSLVAGASYTIVSYALLSSRVPSTDGFLVYNSQGTLVYDAELGYLQVLDSIYYVHPNLYSMETTVLPVMNSHLPLEASKLFLIQWQTPRATTGGTIVSTDRRYVGSLVKTSNSYSVNMVVWGKQGNGRLQNYNHVAHFLIAYVNF